MADLEGQHNLGRARFGGTWNMEIQALLSASALNLKRLARVSGKVAEGSAPLFFNYSRKADDLFSAAVLLGRPALFSASNFTWATDPSKRPGALRGVFAGSPLRRTPTH